MHPTQQGVLKSGHWEDFQDSATQNDTSIIKQDIIQEKADTIYKDAFNKGYEQGQADAINSHNKTQSEQQSQEKAKLDIQNNLLSQIANSIQEKQIRIHSSIQSECIKIIQQVSTSILKAELSVNPDRLQSAIEDALRLLNESNSISLYLHPETYNQISSLFSHNDINIFADPALSPEDFYLTQNYSKLDGRLTTRVDQAISSLFNHS